MDMSQYRALFLSETREHLNNLNKLTVALEQTPDDRETVNALFREAHSIKGMAATMGFEQTTRLAHRLEDMLDAFRSGGAIPSGIIDYLLSGIDLLEELLGDLEGNRSERDIEAFLRSSPDSDAQDADAATLPGDDEPEFAADVNDLVDAFAIQEESAADNGTTDESDAFQVLIDIAEGAAVAAARGLLALRELEKAGSLISSKPTMAELRGGSPCRELQAWVSSSLERQHIEAALLRIADVERVRFVDDRRKRESRKRDETVRTIRVRTDLLDQFINLTGELITQRYMLNGAVSGRDWGELESSLEQTSRLIDDLHHSVLQARLLPLESITGRLPRIIRDQCRASGKKATLRLTGADVGIDRVVLEALTDPLVHLVRNAVDHGIDDEGAITISARREKDLVLVEVADDGVGMDPERMRQRAVEKELLTLSQVESLSDRDALMLVCLPGFSTARAVTETSGRGVGMDVVKSAVQNLGGSLDIISALGEGTRFQLHLPLSVAIIKILLVSCAGHPLAIPITRIERTIDLPTKEIQQSAHERVFRHGDEVISLVSLPQILGLPEIAESETTWVVITEIHGRKIGLQVDRFLGQREAFVKALGFPLNHLSGLTGATVEGDGRVTFIVDPQTLLEQHYILPDQ